MAYSTPQIRSLALSATQILDAAFFETSVTIDVMNCACTCGQTLCGGAGSADTA